MTKSAAPSKPAAKAAPLAVIAKPIAQMNEKELAAYEQRTLDALKPGLWSQFVALKQARQAATSCVAQYHWDLGKACNALEKEDNISGKAALSSLLGETAETVAISMKIATAWPKQVDLMRIINVRSKAGKPLDITSLSALASPDLTKEMRDNLIKEIAEKGLTTDALRAKIQETLGGKRSSGGRPFARPNNLGEAAAAINKGYAEVQTRLTKVWFPAIEEYSAKISAGEYEAGDLAQIEATLESLDAVAASTEDARARLKDAATKLRRAARKDDEVLAPGRKPRRPAPPVGA